MTETITHHWNEAHSPLYLSGLGGEGVRGFGDALRGVDPNEARDSETMLKLAGLDWTIEQHPVYVNTGSGYAEIPGKVANCRSDTGDALGVVSKGYTPLQNATSFSFADELVQSGDGGWIGAASQAGGARVTGLMRLDRDVKIAGLEDERILPLLGFRNGHDGGTGVAVFCAPFRLACLNGMLLPVKGATRVWRYRHTSGILRHVDEARRALSLSWTYYDELEELGNKLVAKRMPSKEFDRFMGRLVPLTPAMTADPDSRAAKNREEAVEAITALFHHSENLENVRSTRWAALQAVTEWSDWSRPVKSTRRSTADENRLTRALKPNALVDHAVGLLTA